MTAPYASRLNLEQRCALAFQRCALPPAIADDRSRTRERADARTETSWERALSLGDLSRSYTEATLHGSGSACGRLGTCFYRALGRCQSAPALERGSASNATLPHVASSSKEAVRSQNYESRRPRPERPRGRNCPLSRCRGKGYGIPAPRFSTFTWKLGPELQFRRASAVIRTPTGSLASVSTACPTPRRAHPDRLDGGKNGFKTA